MPRLIVNAFSISIDGFGAGPDQDLDHPLGVGGERLHDWLLSTRTWQRLHELDGGETGAGDDYAARGFERIGAWILGRNPYHVPVFVLTHHAREPVAMRGGTEFRFVTSGIEDALEQAKAAAGDNDVRLGGGVATIREYLGAGLIDELHLAISPVLLGRGEHLLGGIDLPALGYACAEHQPRARAAHVVLRKDR